MQGSLDCTGQAQLCAFILNARIPSNRSGKTFAFCVLFTDTTGTGPKNPRHHRRKRPGILFIKWSYDRTGLMAPALRLGAGPGGGTLEAERLRYTTIELQRQCTARTVMQQAPQETHLFSKDVSSTGVSVLEHSQTKQSVTLGGAQFSKQVHWLLIGFARVQTLLVPL